MKIEEMLSRTREAIGQQRVFGEPIERDGTLIIPVAKVMGGGGGGAGFPGMPMPVPPRAGEDETAGGATVGEPEAIAAGGSGAGFGVVAAPAGVYVIHDGEVRWVPSVDVNRLALAGMVTTVIAILLVRSIVRSIVRR